MTEPAEVYHRECSETDRSERLRPPIYFHEYSTLETWRPVFVSDDDWAAARQAWEHARLEGR
jgi:hypothetical protein